jgi:hypothetical protein
MDTERTVKVFVTQHNPRMDYSSATKYGELVPIVSRFVPFGDTHKIMNMIAASLATASEEDYVMVTGAGLLNVLVIVTWLSRFDKVKLLSWVNQPDNSGYYKSFIVDVNEGSVTVATEPVTHVT